MQLLQNSKLKFENLTFSTLILALASIVQLIVYKSNFYHKNEVRQNSEMANIIPFKKFLPSS